VHKRNQLPMRGNTVWEHSLEFSSESRELIDRKTIVLELFGWWAHGSEDRGLVHVDVFVDVEEVSVEYELVHDSIKGSEKK
jgi:hypothetical protein